MDRQAPNQVDRIAPAAIIVMGVAGSGKSLVGEALATATGAAFIEGDRLHPPENVAKMASGVPLTDEDRKSWLDSIGRQIAMIMDEGRSVVATCSALKQVYRDRLRSFDAGIHFLFLDLEPTQARLRVAGRRGHFMPASLVDSQFAILEPPRADEAAMTVDATLPVGDIVAAASPLLVGHGTASKA